MMNKLIEQDKLHRRLALDASKSFIVQAPAGSGKTELLIQRFLTLLAKVKAPEEVLAITFTKKAASEMRMRVLKALKQASEPEPDSEHQKQTWLLARNVLQQDKQFQWNIINNPNQLRIQTIDSFCTHLTRQLPLLSHFGSQPDIADFPIVLYREAIQEVLMHVEENYEWSDAITELLLHLDNDLNKLHDLLVTLLGKRDQWLPYVPYSTNDDEIRDMLENQLQLIISDALTAIQTIFPRELAPELLAIARYASSHANNEVRSCEILTSLPGNQAEDKTAWLGLAKLLLTKSFSWRKKVDEEIGFPALKNLKHPHEIATNREYRQRLNDLVMKLEDHENLRLALEELFFLPHPVYTDSQWRILQSLLHVLKIAAAQLRVTFQQHGQIDFIENTQAALAALGNDETPTDLALALDYQIQHILIDEFQDTSHTQHLLLEKLIRGWERNDGRTLFVVGDPMQSIYRFREAEVGLFIRMRSKGIAHLELTPLSLAINFRSSSNIVEWNNTHFHKIFPSFNDMATGAVSYSKSVAHANQAETENTISVHGFVNAAKDTEANQIVEVINKTQLDHPQDKIAILVRSRSHLQNIIPALKKAKLSFRAIDIDALSSRQSICDLLSLTCALLHPADRISWLSVLRAPWCGLSLADLHIIAGSDAYAAIYTQLQSKELSQKLSVDGQTRVNKIMTIISAKIAERERHPLRAWVESTWLLLGGPATLATESDIDDANAYFSLLQEFTDKNQLLNLDKLKERINQLYASTQHDEASIHIMTIHTAKGLEFDTVILPQLSRKNPHDDKALLAFIEQPLSNEQMALLLAPIHATGSEKDMLYEYITRQQKNKSDYETDRLFYVATTRAKKRLHLFFNITRNDNGKDRIDSGSFIAKAWPLLEKQKDTILTVINQNENIESENNITRPIKRITSKWLNPHDELVSQNSSAHKKQSGFQLRDLTPSLIGTVIHRILQIISETNIDWWLSKTENEKVQYCELLLKQSGVSLIQLAHARQSVINAIQNTIHDERGRWILSKHVAAKSEFAITSMIDNQIENIVIDRTFIDDNNVLWIIDYKTASLQDQPLDKFLEREKKKHAEQMQKYHRVLSLQHEGTIRLGLYFPVNSGWVEWESNIRSSILIS